MSCIYAQCNCFTVWKETPFSSHPLSAAQFSAWPQNNMRLPSTRKLRHHVLLPVVAVAQKYFRENGDQGTDIIPSTSDEGCAKATRGSGTTARGRRLLKVREEKRKREYERLQNYPAWAKVLEGACRNDSELRAVLGDSIGNPELMRKKVEERVRKRGNISQNLNRDLSLDSKLASENITFSAEKRVETAESPYKLKVLVPTFCYYYLLCCFNPLDSYIWFELYGTPSDRDVDLLGSVIQSWYVMGRLGAFNSANLQLANASMEYDPLYDAEKGFEVMPSSFHDISNVEFQDNWGRIWVDLGTADFFSIDILLNSLTVLSSEYLGIQQVVFGGRRMGDWEEGMTSPEFGYKSFKI